MSPRQLWTILIGLDLVWLAVAGFELISFWVNEPHAIDVIRFYLASVAWIVLQLPICTVTLVRFRDQPRVWAPMLSHPIVSFIAAGLIIMMLERIAS